MSAPRCRSREVREVREVARDFAPLGWTWSLARSGAVRWAHSKHGPVFSPGALSVRAERNLRAELRRAMRAGDGR